jgi:PAS domain S-box-containing protein
MIKRIIYLNKRFLLVLFLIICLIISFLSYLYFQYERSILIRDKQENLQSIANLKIEQITNWLNERNGDAKILSSNYFFINSIKSWLNNRNNKLIKNDLINLFTEFKSSFGYEDLIIIDTKGRSLLSLTSGNDKTDPYLDSYINEALKNNKIINSDLYLSKANLKIYCDIIVPLLNNSEEKNAVLILRIDPYEYFYPLIQSWPTESKSSETLLVRNEGENIIFINELRHQKNTALSLEFPLTKTELPSVQAVLGYTGIFEGVDYSGAKVLADVRPVPGTKWFLVTKIDRSEIYSDLYYREFFIIIFTSLIMIMSGGIITWFYLYKQKNSYKKLYLKEKSLSETREEYRTTLYSIGDGVITTNKKGIIRQMNPVAEKLTGYSEIEAKGKKLDEVFKIINEESLAKVINPAEKVLEEGLIVGLANHTLLVSKDGRQIPIADSGAPIRNKSNEIIGVVLVFRDQSLERDAQKNLIDSEKRYHTTLDNMIEGCRIIGFDLKIIYINNSAAGYTGKDKNFLTGRHLLDDHPEYKTSGILNDINKCLEKKISVFKEYEFFFSDKRWFEISIQPVPEGIFMVSLDITDRKKAEELLKKNRELLEKTQAIAHLGGWELDLKTNKGYWSKEMYKLYDIEQAGDLIDFSKFIDHIHPEDRTILMTKQQEALQKNGVYNIIYRTNPEFCKSRIINSSLQCVKNEKGEAVSLVGTSIDITEIKEAEEKIKKGLEEKEILLRELYHRTKNNMQVICAMLSLQADYYNNPELEKIIEETNNRIKSMALVHQMLYQAKNLSNINLKDYLYELISLLSKSYLINPEKIKFNLELDSILIPIDTAIPCGLILTELISNIFKHAFPEKRTGTVLVKLSLSNDGVISIFVKDDGIGVKDDFDFMKQKSLGLKIIYSVTESQLHGNVSFEMDKGIVCRINFNNKQE